MTQEPHLNRSNRRVGLIAAALVVGMTGMAFAAVPLYRIFCQVTGFAGTTQRAEAAAGAVENATITVRFDSNVNPDLPWKFHQVQNTQTLKIGEQGMAYYKATNLSDKPVTGTATFNVTPDIAGSYFNKIECFCFTEQLLEAGQSMDMPVIYFIDPAILDDPRASRISEITLSYTFYKMDNPAEARQQVTGATEPAVGATRI